MGRFTEVKSKFLEEAIHSKDYDDAVRERLLVFGISLEALRDPEDPEFSSRQSRCNIYLEALKPFGSKLFNKMSVIVSHVSEGKDSASELLDNEVEEFLQTGPYASKVEVALTKAILRSRHA